MGERYVVFWIPVVSKNKLIPIRYDFEDDFSEDKKTQYIIHLSLDRSNFNLNLTAPKHKAEFIFISNNIIGLSQYKITYEPSEYDESLNIDNEIYHLFKGLYHIHNYHNGDEDSLLFAYYSDNLLDLEDNTNPALLHYLNLYEEKFKGYHNNLYVYNTSFELEQPLKNTDKYKRLKGLYEKLNIAIVALGENIYCNTLLSSKPTDYNDFNITNTIEEIRCQKSKIEASINQKSTLLFIKLSLISLIFGIISIIISIISSMTSPSKSELKVIKLELNKIEQEYNTHKKQDSINYLNLKTELIKGEKNISLQIKNLGDKINGRK